MGDRIASVNDTQIDNWDEFIVECALNTNVELGIETIDGETKTIAMETEAMSQGGRMLTGLAKSTPSFVMNVVKGGSAAAAGIESGDIITRFADRPVMGVDHLIDIVDQHAGQSVAVTIRRKGEKIETQVTPEFNEEYGRALIGVTFNPFDINRKPLEQIKAWGSPVFRILKALVTPSEAKNAASALGGPVSIFRMFWWAASSSLLLALWFTGLINVNLAIMNILPIPILDGGHLMFTLIEIVTRRPLNAKIMLVVYKFFFILLITAILLITFNDFRRIFEPLLPQSVEESEDAGAPNAEQGE
jgi:regulator of sigma E protease